LPALPTFQLLCSSGEVIASFLDATANSTCYQAEDPMLHHCCSSQLSRRA
jgi:hypothetical protein